MTIFRPMYKENQQILEFPSIIPTPLKRNIIKTLIERTKNESLSKEILDRKVKIRQNNIQNVTPSFISDITTTILSSNLTTLTAHYTRCGY